MLLKVYTFNTLLLMHMLKQEHQSMHELIHFKVNSCNCFDL